MMTTLWDTTGTAVVKALAAERRTGGAVTCGLALTLVVVIEEKHAAEAEAAATDRRVASTRAGCSSWSGATSTRRCRGSTPRCRSAAGSGRARRWSCGCTAGWRCTPSR